MNKKCIRIISENRYPLVKKHWPRRWQIFNSVNKLIQTFQLYHFYI